jgi:hypothetical protein
VALPPAMIVVFAMVVLWQLQDLIFNSPVCGYCNRRREHARDCPMQKK